MTGGIGPRADTTRAVLHRPRLVAALNAAVRAEAPLLSVYGPAGAGKSTLLLDWLGQLPARAAAVLVEPLGAGARVSRRRGVTETVGLDEMPDLVEDLRGARPGIVVVDGIDAFADPAALRRLLPAGRQLYVVLAGRNGPERAVPAVAAHDLRLTSAETAQLCALRGVEMGPATARRLYAVTDGWAAGAAIAVDMLQYGSYDTQQQLDEILRTGADLAAYLEHEVLAAFPREVRDAILAASILTSVNAELLAAMTGRPASDEMLSGLAEHDRFLVALEDASGWYRYPRLWGAALRHRLGTTNPQRLRALHRSAAWWYAEHSEWEEGRRHAAAALGPALSEPMPVGRRRRRHGPDAVLEGTGLDRAWPALQAGDPVRARRHLDAVPDTRPGGPVAMAAVRMEAVADYLQGRLRAAARAAAGLRAALHGRGVADSPEEGWALLTLAAVAVDRGEPDLAHGHLDELLIQNWPPDPRLQAGEAYQRLRAIHQAGRSSVALASVEQIIADETERLVVPVWAPRATRIELLLARGLVHDATRHLEADGGEFPPVVAALAEASLALSDPADRHAAPAVERLLAPYLEGQGCLTHAVEARLLLARAARRAGNDEEADGLVRRASAMAAEEHLRHPFIVRRMQDEGTETTTRRRPAALADAPAPVPTVEGSAELTEAEAGVLRMLIGFLTLTEIAAAMHLSPNTVKTHVAAIYRKLGVHRRRDAIRLARELGLV